MDAYAEPCEECLYANDAAGCDTDCPCYCHDDTEPVEED